MAAYLSVREDEVVVEEVGGEDVSKNGVVKPVAHPGKERMHAEEGALLTKLVELRVSV